MADFHISKDILGKMEGTYANDPNDSGGETYKGIARNAHPTWPGWAIVDAAKAAPHFPASLDKDPLVQSKVFQFYKVLFWDVSFLDQCPSQAVANELFEQSVNIGLGVSIPNLQRVLNALNRGHDPATRLFDDLKVDGNFGQKTLDAMKIVLARTHGEEVMVNLLDSFQGVRYVDACERALKNRKFLWGWARQRLR